MHEPPPGLLEDAPPSSLPEDAAMSGSLRARGAGSLVFGRFRLVRELGAGGMAVVWLANDERLGLEVALKFLPGLVAHDPEALHDLRREITRGLKLTHPGIVRVFDLHEDSSEGIAAIAMEYVDGPTLAEEKLRQPRLYFEVREPLISWVRALCDVIQYVHEEARVVHRDLKPRNLMLTAAQTLKVADFGIAATLSDSQSRATQAGGTSGTPAYMSPQQALGRNPTPADDIYAIGATIYELITSKPPFFRGGMGVILNQVATEVPAPMQQRREELGITDAGPIPAMWEETVAACLAKDPAARPASVRELSERLAVAASPLNAATERAVPSELSRQVTAAAPASRQARHWAIPTVAAAVVIAAGAAYLLKARSARAHHEVASLATPATPTSAPTSAKADGNFSFACDLCFRQNQWKQGLALLAKGNGPLKAAAEAELRWPANVTALEIARAWAAGAEQCGLPDKWYCFNRARYWYGAAEEEAGKTGGFLPVHAEKEKLPMLRATLRLHGASPYREQVEIRRNLVIWESEGGGGPYLMTAGMNTLTFNLKAGPHPLTPDERSRILPEGVDFSTAKLGPVHFGGKTGSVTQILFFDIPKEQNPPAGLKGGAIGTVVKWGEKNAAHVRYPGGFDFDITLKFGEP